MGRDPSVFLHECALCESDDVGPRTRVWAFAHIMRGARVGADCNIGEHAFVESGATLGNRVTVKNAVLIWEKVTIEDEVFLGPNMVFTNVRNLRAALRPKPEEFLPTLVRRGARDVLAAGGEPARRSYWGAAVGSGSAEKARDAAGPRTSKSRSGPSRATSISLASVIRAAKESQSSRCSGR